MQNGRRRSIYRLADGSIMHAVPSSLRCNIYVSRCVWRRFSLTYPATTTTMDREFATGTSCYYSQDPHVSNWAHAHPCIHPAAFARCRAFGALVLFPCRTAKTRTRPGMFWWTGRRMRRALLSSPPAPSSLEVSFSRATTS